MMPGGMPPDPMAGKVDMAAVLQFFQETVKGLVASGMPMEQALGQAMQMVSQRFGPEAAQQLALAATQGGGGSAPAAEGPGSYGPAAPNGTGMMMPPPGVS